MDLIEQLEKYIINLLLGFQDPISDDRLKSYHTINLVFDNNTISYLLNLAKEIPLIINEDLNKYLSLCYEFIKNNDRIELINILNKLDSLDIPELYQYFFNKIIIKIKIEEFNSFPFIDNMIDDFPKRILVKNQIDLIEDIIIIKNYLEYNCFNNMEIIAENINNKYKDYIYFIKLLKYQICILSETKIIFSKLLKNIINIENYF